MTALPEFTTIESCPSNRERLDAWYRKALPMLTKGSNTWAHLRTRGNAIKRQWFAAWKQHDQQPPSATNLIPFRRRHSPETTV